MYTMYFSKNLQERYDFYFLEVFFIRACFYIKENYTASFFTIFLFAMFIYFETNGEHNFREQILKLVTRNTRKDHQIINLKKQFFLLYVHVTFLFSLVSKIVCLFISLKSQSNQLSN